MCRVPSTSAIKLPTLRANGLFNPYSQINTRGFTLLELLIVLVIVGITLGMVSFNAMPNDQKVLQNDAQRIALLLQTARDEAIVRNHPIAFEAEPDRYRFLIYDENTWQVLKQDDLLRERELKKSPVTFSIRPSSLEQALPIRIIFGREPVDKPFALTLSLGEASVVIHADGIGHFVVE
jgi:general secretion pathway protein H